MEGRRYNPYNRHSRYDTYDPIPRGCGATFSLRWLKNSYRAGVSSKLLDRRDQPLMTP